MRLQRFLLIILLFTTASIGVYSTCISFFRPYTGITLAVDGEISAFDSHGPAALVGIRATDRVLEIDGVPLNASQAFYRGVTIGDPITLGVVRGDNILEYTLTTTNTPPHATANQLVIMVLGWIFWCFGFLLYTRNHPKFNALHFIIFAISIATALFALEDAERGYGWARYTMYCVLPINGAAWLNVHRDFPVKVDTVWRRVCDFIYVIAIIITVVTLTLGPNALTQIATWLGFSPLLPSNIIRIFWAVECIAGLWLLVRGYRVQVGDVRRRVRFVAVGSLIGLVPVATILIAEAMRFYLIPNTVALTGLLALPVTYSISLTQADIIRLETKFYRTLIIATSVFLIPLIYLGVISVLSWLHPSLAASPIIGALTALLLTVSYGNIHLRIELVFRRIFFGETQNHFKQLNVMTDMVKTLSSRLDEKTIISLLVSRIPIEINVDKSGLWLLENNTLVWKGGELNESPDTIINQDITAIRDVSLAKPRLFQNKMFPSGEAIRWWIPLVTSEQGEDYELHGLWLLGPRQNDESFSPEDIELLNAAAQESAIAIKAIHLLSELRVQLSQTQQAWRRTIRIREEEQQRIAIDLHDDVIQLMFHCALNIQTSLRLLEEDKSPIQILEQTRQKLLAVGEQTRLICYNLRPDALTHLDLPEMMRHLIQQAESQISMPFKVKSHISLNTKQQLQRLEETHLLDQQTKIELYRIAQEALNNVAKHADATTVIIAVEANIERVQLCIYDDGKGFDLKKLVATRNNLGLGLTTIRARAKDLNAAVLIDSEVGTGTRITVTLPYSSLGKIAMPKMVYSK